MMLNTRALAQKLFLQIIILLLFACTSPTPTAEHETLLPGSSETPQQPTQPLAETPSPAIPTAEITPVFTFTPPSSPTLDPFDLPRGQWVELAPMNVPRGEMPAVTLDGKIYTIGGLLDGSGLRGTAESEIYDPASNAWVPMAPLPAIRHHGMAAEFEGRVFYFGGADTNTLTASAEAWVYDPASDAWQSIAPLPDPRASGWAGVAGEFIYILGGTGTGVGNTRVLRYDPVADAWERLEPIPENREHIAGAVFDDQIYIFGGRWAQGAREYKTVLLYDPESGNWARTQPMLDDRTGFPAAVLGNKVYVFGGELFMTVSPGVALDSAEVFDLATNSWSYLPPMPVSLHGMPAVAVEDVLYVLGGSNVAARAVNAGRLYAFRP